MTRARPTARQPARNRSTPPAEVGQVVLVLQGGGALGAFQLGVYEALHEAGMEPDWVIGTSIGAINAALIAGNLPAERTRRIAEFWERVTHLPATWNPNVPGLARMFANWGTLSRGVPGFFEPRAAAWWGLVGNVGLEEASFYRTDALDPTLRALLDVGRMNANAPRLTVGAVNVHTGAMRYFDSRDEHLDLEHVRASGALPPAFPAVRIDGVPYWDGGLYSSTPIEAVLDDMPRRDSLIFSVNVWQPTGVEPRSIWEVVGRQKDIQYASRADSHIARQKQIHRLRHVIRQLSEHLPETQRRDAEVKALVDYGCGTTMHVVRLLAPALDDDDHTKDIDFTEAGIAARRAAGYRQAATVLQRRPWLERCDPIEGVVEHEAG